MNHYDTLAYGVWSLVLINTAIFVIFAFGFTHPRTAQDWRSFGVFSMFLLVLFTEMYGFPLAIYLLSSWHVVEDRDKRQPQVRRLPGHPVDDTMHLDLLYAIGVQLLDRAAGALLKRYPHVRSTWRDTRRDTTRNAI